MLAEQRGALALRVEAGFVGVFAKGLQRARASGKGVGRGAGSATISGTAAAAVAPGATNKREPTGDPGSATDFMEIPMFRPIFTVLSADSGA